MVRKVIYRYVLFAFLAIILLVNKVQGQFLNMEDPSYLNFGWLDYRNYRENYQTDAY